MKRTYSGIPVTFINDEDDVKIYAIKETKSSSPVYIGSTNQPLRARMQCHISDAMKDSALPIHEWIRTRENGFTVEVIERVIGGRNRFEREQYWVSQFPDLLNVTDGGPGLSGHRYAGTEHAIENGMRRKTSIDFTCIECGSVFYRKRSQAILGNSKFCSKDCYQSWQRGKSKSNESGLMGVAGRAAALAKRRAQCLHS